MVRDVVEQNEARMIHFGCRPMSISYRTETPRLCSLTIFFHFRPMRRRILVTRSKSSEWTTQSTVPNNVVRLEHRSLPSLTLPSDSVTHSIRRQWKRLLIGGLAAVLCSISNVAAPVLMGILFEYLVLGAPLQQYIQTLTILCVSYTIEPILSQFYIRNVIAAEETVLAELRKEIFQRLLHEEVSFYDQHETTEFTNFLTVELDTLRNFVFANVSRDRGLRSILEVLGVMIVLFTLSWRLAPILAGPFSKASQNDILLRCDFHDHYFRLNLQTLHQIGRKQSIPNPIRTGFRCRSSRSSYSNRTFLWWRIQRNGAISIHCGSFL